MSFEVHTVGLGTRAFEALSRGLELEAVGRGRGVLHLTEPEARGVPLVRTTSRLERPAHVFTEAHRELVAALAGVSPEGARFNAALLEIYDRGYAKMGYHSDQALDLEPGTWIALYSCYERPQEQTFRRFLRVKEKGGEEEVAIPLEHDSAVVFSLEANARHVHKIVLPSLDRGPDNRWLGVTMRCARTFLRREGEAWRLPDGEILRLAASEEERRWFYRLRGQENRDPDFVYPPVPLTLSPGDLLAPVNG